MQFIHQGRGLFPDWDFIISITDTAELTLLDIMHMHVHYVEWVTIHVKGLQLCSALNMSEALVKCLYVPQYRPLGINFSPKNKEHFIIYNVKKNCGFLRHVRDIVLGWFDDLNHEGINIEIDFTQFSVHCV